MEEVQDGPSPGEGIFERDQMFFSRTDPRGVIQSGNDVFVRVSGFSGARLVGAPHRVIRHRDMPRGVFHLFWDYLKAGRPIGAYVKNRTRTGLSYWVYAVATPVEGGYLSVRIRPESQICDSVQKEYEALLAREKEEKLSPEQSAEALRARIQELGFSGYGDFMTRALAEEIKGRDAFLKREPDAEIARMIDLGTRLGEVETAAEDLRRRFAEVADIPSNMQIMASRIERAGGPVGVLSISYMRMAEDALHRLRALSGDGGANDTAEVLRSGLFMLCIARIQEEVANQSLQVRDQPAADLAVERPILAHQNRHYQDQARQALDRIETMVKARADAARDLHRMVLGLDSVRLLCRVESGRLGGDAGELGSIVRRLDRLHTDLDRQLDRVNQMADAVTEQVSRFRLRQTTIDAGAVRTPASQPAASG